MVTIDIDGKRVWPIPSRHAAILTGATKDEDGSVTYQYTPLQPGPEHSLLVRIDPDEAKEIVRAWRSRPGGDSLPTSKEIVEEIERHIEKQRHIEKRKNSGKAGKD